MLTTDQRAASAFRALRERLDQASIEEKPEILHAIAQDLRREDLLMIQRAGAGHIGGDMSVVDILATLFAAILNVDPAAPNDPARDRFILSKGHTAGMFYATLAYCGFFSQEELKTFLGAQSLLNGHPDRKKVPGVETNTGPLGHGLPVGVGTAIGAKLQGSSRRTVVVLGDGELQEGSNWEAAMTAAHYGLGSLTAVVDRNRLQQGARTEDTMGLDPLPEKWASFGWEVREVDGHDYHQLLEALTHTGGSRPVCVIANTVKGKGISFIEDRAAWHHKVPTDEQVESALEELTR